MIDYEHSDHTVERIITDDEIGVYKIWTCQQVSKQWGKNELKPNKILPGPS